MYIIVTVLIVFNSAIETILFNQLCIIIIVITAV